MRKEFFKEIQEEIFYLSGEMALSDAIEHLIIAYGKPLAWIDDMPSEIATPTEFKSWWKEMLS